MAENYSTAAPEYVGRFEYLASDISVVPLVFKRTAYDYVRASECGRYLVVRTDLGEGYRTYDAILVMDRGREEGISLEASFADAQRACELHAGRMQRFQRARNAA